MKIYIHLYLPNKHSLPPDTYYYELENDQETFQDLINNIAKIKKDVNPQLVKVKTMPMAKDLLDNTLYIKSVLNENEDILLYCNVAKPVQVQEVQEKQIYYENIQKYTFYEYDEWRSRVILDLPDIHKLPPENITVRFLDRGLEVKIMNYKSKNYRFAVPKTHVYLNPKDCRYYIKENKIMLTLKKLNEKDQFFSLFVQRTWGGYDDIE